jgi:uncharacterized protein (TIGR02145 family)
VTQQGQAQCKNDAKINPDYKAVMQHFNTMKYSEELFKNEYGDLFSHNFFLIENSLHILNDSCKSVAAFTKEGSKVSSVDENKQFCLNGVAYDKCNGKAYDPINQKCENNIALSKCGNGWLNSEQQYCSKNVTKDYYFMTDSRDGKKYKAVVIGKQTWMAQNIDYHGTDGFLGLCYGDRPKDKIKNPENCQKYGRLYDWEEAKKACPKGWHLPSGKEWKTLVDFAGGNKVAQTKLKAKIGWKAYDFSGKSPKAPKCKWIEEKIDDRGRTTITEHDKCNTDEFSFSALPNGGGASNGKFYDSGDYGYLWSSSEYDNCSEYMRYMNKGDGDLPGGISFCYNGGRDGENDGSLFSVRCIQD